MYIFSWDSPVSFASLSAFTYAYPVSFLSKCYRKEPQRRSCSSNILPQRSSYAFVVQPQRSSCGFQDSSSSDPQSAARRTSSCGCKKKFLRMHYFWAVLYSLLLSLSLRRLMLYHCLLVITLGFFLNFSFILVITRWWSKAVSAPLCTHASKRDQVWTSCWYIGGLRYLVL